MVLFGKIASPVYNSKVNYLPLLQDLDNKQRKFSHLYKCLLCIKLVFIGSLEFNFQYRTTFLCETHGLNLYIKLFLLNQTTKNINTIYWRCYLFSYTYTITKTLNFLMAISYDPVNNVMLIILLMINERTTLYGGLRA